MDPAAHVAAVRDEGAVLVAAVADGPSTAPVPTCPGWTVHDLAAHVGGFCGFWAHVLCEGTGRPKATFDEAPHDEASNGGALSMWLDGLVSTFVSELEATPAGTAVWTWFDPDRTAGFVSRRGAHELAIHRYDAQSARGTTRAVDALLATDGIDELLGPLLVTRDHPGSGSGRAMALECTDTGARWMVTLETDRISVARSEAGTDADDHLGGRPTDLTIRGTASDLELLLYARPPTGRPEQSGDATVLEEWYRDFTF
jgi:uncharacterized protein (TIGR03083 family)